MILYENGLHNHDSRMAEDTVADTVSQAVEKAVENPLVAQYNNNRTFIVVGCWPYTRASLALTQTYVTIRMTDPGIAESHILRRNSLTQKR